MRRIAAVEAASQALDHSELPTTLGSSAIRISATGERAMDLFARTRDDEDAASRGNDSPSRLD
jgi:hypothetical protein